MNELIRTDPDGKLMQPYFEANDNPKTHSLFWEYQISTFFEYLCIKTYPLKTPTDQAIHFGKFVVRTNYEKIPNVCIPGDQIVDEDYTKFESSGKDSTVCANLLISDVTTSTGSKTASEGPIVHFQINESLATSDPLHHITRMGQDMDAEYSSLGAMEKFMKAPVFWFKLREKKPYVCFSAKDVDGCYSFYRGKVCGGVDPERQTVRIFAMSGRWTEIFMIFSKFSNIFS